MKCVQAFCLYHFFIPVAHKSFPFLKLNLACHDLVMGLSKEAESPGYWHRGQLGLAVQGIFSAATGMGRGSFMEALYPLLKLHRNTLPDSFFSGGLLAAQWSTWRTAERVRWAGKDQGVLMVLGAHPLAH